MKTAWMACALSVMVAGAVSANEPQKISPWPPVTTDRHAPHNWPVPHPAPAVNLNTVPSGLVFRALPKAERQRVQFELARVNLYAGEIDGIWGPQTFFGVRAYAQSLDLEHTLNSTQGAARILRHIAH